MALRSLPPAGVPDALPSGGRGVTRDDTADLVRLPREASLAAGPATRGELLPEPLLDVDAVAAALGVTRWSIYRWAAQGRIPCLKLGRKRRFELAAVVDALRSDYYAGGQPDEPTRHAPSRRNARSGPAHRPAEHIAARPKSEAERLRAVMDATRALASPRR